MFYVYVLLSLKDKNFYTGYTENLRKRLREHQQGKVTATRHRLPIILLYYEACINKYDALKREKYLKTTMGKRFIRNRLKNYLKDLKD